MKQVSEFLKSKTTRMCFMLCMVVSMLAVSAFADDGTSAAATLTSAFQSGFSSFVSDAMNMLGIAVVAAIPLAGSLWIARKAMSWFRSVAK